MTPQHSRYARRAVTIVFVAVVTPLIVGFTALAVDVGLIYAMDAETQRAVDAAALAGVSALASVDSTTAVQRANEFLGPNFQSQTGSPNTSVIQVGKWDPTARTFTANAAKPNAVRVTATRHDAPLFFAAIFGAFHYDMTRAATAMLDPPFPCSVWGLQGVTMGGGGITDSYDSTIAAYNAGTAGSKGNVCSCRNVALNGSGTTVNGEAYYGSGYAFSTTGHASTTGGSDVLPSCINPTIDMTYASTHNNNAAVGYGSGAAVNLGSHATLTLPAGTYYFSSISLHSHSNIACSGNVTIYVTGSISNNGGSVTNGSSDPWNLTVYCNGSSIDWNGQSDFYGAILAPNAAIDYQGGTDMFGILVGRTLDIRGGSAVHVDLSLPSYIMNNGPPALVK